MNLNMNNRISFNGTSAHSTYRGPDPPQDEYTRAIFGSEDIKTYSEETDKISEHELFKPNLSGIDFKKYENIPVECSGSIPPITVFDETVGISDIVLKNIFRASYKTPTPVQKYAIPIGLREEI